MRWRHFRIAKTTTCTIAAVYGLLRIRQGGLMRLSTDLESEYQPRRAMEYY
jgi:hypothetical protein